MYRLPYEVSKRKEKIRPTFLWTMSHKEIKTVRGFKWSRGRMIRKQTLEPRDPGIPACGRQA
jgi:hypothetical protein